MKYYESHYEEYIHVVDKYNLHPELTEIYNSFPVKISILENLIIYGPPGVGKYSQVLYLLKRYSPSGLKYDKKLTAQTDKQSYIYHISDIHYEIDMSLLGCNSKQLWHELFSQIVDIISVKAEKVGIIVCKNFHLIHTELLENFYSYIQHYNHSQTNIKIVFFIITEHISFLPSPILNICKKISVCRPSKKTVIEMIEMMDKENAIVSNKKRDIIKRIDIEGVLNMKEIQGFSYITSTQEIPKDVFNIICDNIIREIIDPKRISFTKLRDMLYDILTYNLDMTECLWYIVTHLIENKKIKTDDDISAILDKSYSFLKHYNNNYRPIYHIESIIFYIINKIHHF